MPKLTLRRIKQRMYKIDSPHFSIVREMHKAGITPNEPWVLDSAERACKMYGGQLHRHGMALAVSSRWAIDYLEQAPWLVMLMCAKTKLGAITDMAREFKRRCAEGPNLKDLMKSYRMPVQLRKICGEALMPGHYKLTYYFSRCNHSALAQAIPEWKKESRECWWSDQTLWIALLLNAGDNLGYKAGNIEVAARYMKWLIAQPNLHRTPVAMTELTDYMLSGVEWNDKWTLAMAGRKCAEWHREIGKRNNKDRFEKDTGLKWDELMDYGGWMDAGDIGALRFRALRSAEALYEEHLAMHHCVDGYASYVARGASRIYSVSKAGRRVATVEYARLGPGGSRIVWEINQIRGPCNEQVEVKVALAAREFLRKQTKAYENNLGLLGPTL